MTGSAIGSLAGSEVGSTVRTPTAPLSADAASLAGLRVPRATRLRVAFGFASSDVCSSSSADKTFPPVFKCAVVLIVAKSATKGGSIETQCDVRWVNLHVWYGAEMRGEGRNIIGSALLKADSTTIRSASADR